MLCLALHATYSEQANTLLIPLIVVQCLTQVNTRLTPSASAFFSSLPSGVSYVTLHLGLLKSYEHMGFAEIECLKGCTCTTTSFNTHDPRDRTSQIVFFSVNVSQSLLCTFSVTSSRRTTSKEHDIVLRAVSVSAHHVL